VRQLHQFGKGVFDYAIFVRRNTAAAPKEIRFCVAAGNI
jgi:hypothetical protein